MATRGELKALIDQLPSLGLKLSARCLSTTSIHQRCDSRHWLVNLSEYQTVKHKFQEKSTCGPFRIALPEPSLRTRESGPGPDGR